MLTELTMDKLETLHLYAMADAWAAQRIDPGIAAIDFDSRFARLVDAETLARNDKRAARLLRQAKLRIPEACLEDIDCSAKRGVGRALVRKLGTGRWIADKVNVVVTGATGVGKTYFACALAEFACRTGFRVLYKRVPRLFEELALAHADGTYIRLLQRLARIDVLVLDDWGLARLTDQQRRDLLEILEDRYGETSTVVTSQLPVHEWDDRIGEPTVADAILDRLVHDAYEIALQGPSKRRPKNRR